MPSEHITAYEISDFDEFCKSIADEAFSDSAILIGKNFFRKNKKDITLFRKTILDNKERHIPEEEYVMREIMRFVFSTAEKKNAMYIMPTDMEYIIEKLSNEISYRMMSKLTDEDFLEMCYSPYTDDIIWRMKK